MRFEAKPLKVALSYGAYMTGMFSGEAVVYRARHEGSESRQHSKSSCVIRLEKQGQHAHTRFFPQSLSYLWLMTDLVILTQ